MESLSLFPEAASTPNLKAAGIESLVEWESWRPLREAFFGTALPDRPGLYRVRRVGRTDLDYIGQTGASLRARVRMLRGLYDPEMPYKDPHAGAPCLWALRDRDGCDFEVSAYTYAGPDAFRRALECLATALYRQQHGRSPTAAFARSIAGYCLSSMKPGSKHPERANRGGRCAEADLTHAPGVAPAGSLDGDPQGSDWCGHGWSPWLNTDEAASQIPPGNGLYRFRDAAAAGLLYIGESDNILKRLKQHLNTYRSPQLEQGRVMRSAGQLEFSFVTNENWLNHQREELESDLIGAHLRNTASVPPMQYKANHSSEGVA